MKKIVIIFVLIFLSIEQTFGCLIKSDMAPSLKEYLEYSKEVLKILEREAGKNAQGLKSPSKIEGANQVIGALNTGIDMESYYLQTILYTNTVKTQEIPKEVKRDYDEIIKVKKEIREAIKQLILSGKGDANIEDFCKSITKGKCYIDTNSLAKNIGAAILQNHQYVENSFISAYVGFKPKRYRLNFVENTFIPELDVYYSQEETSKCSKFFPKMTKQAEKTSKTINNIAEQRNNWVDTWNNLVKVDVKPKENYQDQEDIDLKSELNKHGILETNQINNKKADDKYNTVGKISPKNNFQGALQLGRLGALSDTTRKIQGENVGDIVNQFEESGLPFGAASSTKKNAVKSKTVKERIQRLYSTLVLLSSQSENEADNLRTAIIKSQQKISHSINTLTESCKKAVEMCNRQDIGKGKCGDCN